MGTARARLAASGVWPAWRDLVANPSSRAGVLLSAICTGYLVRRGSKLSGKATVAGHRRFESYLGRQINLPSELSTCRVAPAWTRTPSPFSSSTRLRHQVEFSVVFFDIRSEITEVETFA